MRCSVILVVLSLATIAHGELSCGSNECVPGVENLGRGFDLVTGLLKQVYVVDLEKNGANSTYTNPYHGGVYGVPTDVTVANTPSYDVDSMVFRSSRDYVSYRSLDVGVMFGADWEGGALSLDVDVTKVRQQLEGNDVIVTFAREIQTVYSAQLVGYDRLSVTDTFKKDVDDLPEKFDAGKYQSFIDKYGTHIVQWGLFGGEAILESLFDLSVSEEYTDLTVAFTLKLQLEILKGSVEFAYNKDGFTTDITDKLHFQNLTFAGGDPAVGAQNFSKWVNTVRFSPAFVRSQLVNITTFVRNPAKHENLKQQINDYVISHTQPEVRVPEAPLKLSWCNVTTADTTVSCESENKVVVGTQIHDDYTEMPWDCASPCLSWNAVNAFILHDWDPTNTQQKKQHHNHHQETNQTTQKKQHHNHHQTNQTNQNQLPSFAEVLEAQREESRDGDQNCFSPSFTCGDGACLPGIDLLGIGLDSVTGRRKVIPITKFTYAKNNSWIHPISRQEYVFPDQVSVFDDVTESTSSTVLRSQQELSDYYSGHFGLGIGIPGVFTFGMGIQTSSSVFYSSEALLSITEEDLTFLDLIISSLSPSDELIRSVEKLPSTYDREAYASFIEVYGTHFIEQVTLGGKTIMTNAVDQSYYSNRQDKDMTFEANIMFGGYKLGGTVDTEHSQEYIQYDSSSFSQFNVLGGDSQYYTMTSPTSWSDWENTLYCDPSTVDQEAQSIVDLVSTIDKDKANFLEEMILEYQTTAANRFAKTAVGVAQQPLTERGTVQDSESDKSCPDGEVLLGTEQYHKKSSHYYNLNPQRCAPYQWNNEAQESGRVGPIFTNNCFLASEQSTKHYAGCPPNTFGTGFNSYKQKHGGMSGRPPMTCCSLYFYANSTSTQA